MKHYEASEWSAFYRQDGSLDLTAMEAHLQECNQCLEIFLTNIDEDRVQEAGSLVPEGFAARTSRAISVQRGKTRPAGKSKNRPWIIAYYTAAALLTIVLSGGGLMHNLSGMAAQTPRIGGKLNYYLTHWPEQLKDNTWGRLDMTQFMDGKEVKHEKEE